MIEEFKISKILKGFGIVSWGLRIPARKESWKLSDALPCHIICSTINSGYRHVGFSCGVWCLFVQ